MAALVLRVRPLLLLVRILLLFLLLLLLLLLLLVLPDFHELWILTSEPASAEMVIKSH